MEWYEQHRGDRSPQFITTDSPPRVARVLARLGLSETDVLSGASIEQLVAALKDQRWERRVSAVTMLGKAGAAVSIDPLVNALQDTHEEVRAATARVLGRLGNAVSPSVLITALQDLSPLVREAAVTALGKAGAVVSIDPLVNALQDTHEEVQAAAAQALGRLGNAVPLSALVATLEDPSPLVREAAAEGLGALQNPNARLPLLAHVEDEEALVRDAIARSLMMLEQQECRGLLQILLQALLQEKNQAVLKAAECAVEKLRDLGLDVHEEVAPIVPLVVALQNSDKGIQRIVTCYLVGRALDVINEHVPISPLISLLCVSHQEWEGVWRTIRSLAEKALRERRIIQLLMTATNDRDTAVRTAMTQAVGWLVELALTLHEEQASDLRAVLQNVLSTEYEKTLHYLVQQALDALEEREPLAPLLAALREPFAQKRAETGIKLSKRARKALMGRLPGGPLVLSLKNVLGLTPVELQFGSDQNEEADDQNEEIKENRYRHVFPWGGPELLQLPSLSGPSQTVPLSVAERNACC